MALRIKFAAPFVFAREKIEILACDLHFGLFLTIIGAQRIDFGGDLRHVRGGFVPLNAKGFLVDPEQHLSAGDELVVFHDDLGHPTGNVRANRDLVQFYVGVFGRDDPPAGHVKITAPGCDNRRTEDEE